VTDTQSERHSASSCLRPYEPPSPRCSKRWTQSVSVAPLGGSEGNSVFAKKLIGYGSAAPTRFGHLNMVAQARS